MTLDIDGETVHLYTSNDLPQISPGDALVLLVSAKKSVAMAYYNNTNGSGDLNLLRRRYRLAGLWGIGFIAVAFAVFGTVIIAVSQESLPTSVLIHTPFYLLAIVGGCILSVTGFVCICMTVAMRRIHGTLQLVISNDPRAWAARAVPPESPN
jgi:hypothetical protein